MQTEDLSTDAEAQNVFRCHESLHSSKLTLKTLMIFPPHIDAGKYARTASALEKIITSWLMMPGPAKMPTSQICTMPT